MPTIPEALAIAVEHHQAGRLAEAEQIYRQILAAEPNHADAWHLLGVIAHQAGKHEVAVGYIRRAIGEKGDVPDYHNNLGEAYRALGKVPEAVLCYRRALELTPDHAEAHNNLGIAWKELGKLNEALACYRRALELKPDFAMAHNNLGVALKDQGKLDAAAACYRRALELQPDCADAHSNLGDVLCEQGKPDEAAAASRRALELRPDLAEAHNNLGIALMAQGGLDEAIAGFHRALELRPQFAKAYTNLGAALQGQGDLGAAIVCHRRALELKPDFAEAHNNLGIALRDQGKVDEALACYGRALELKPDLADAHLNRSMLRLLAGNFRPGWSEYEWRWRCKGLAPRDFPQPAWEGEPLAGRTCLLHAEQGLGDTIQFIRYAPLVKQHGGGVVVECQGALLRLLAGCPGIDRLVGRGDQLPAFDVHLPLLSVPRIQRTCLATIPAGAPYVFAEAALVERWRQALAGVPGFRIGINWRGRPGPGEWVRRDVPLQHFAAVTEISPVRLVSLQKGGGPPAERAAAQRLSLWEPGQELDQNGAFTNTAAIMMNLDLVITSDAATAHLAGALGVPVWVALPFVPDWRWLLDRSDSPWYPTMRLFRQKFPGDWASAFREIVAALQERVLRRRTFRESREPK